MQARSSGEEGRSGRTARTRRRATGSKDHLYVREPNGKVRGLAYSCSALHSIALLRRLPSLSIFLPKLGHWIEMMATPSPTPQDSAPYEDRRAYPRVPVAMPAFLQANGERHAVKLLDLSAGGAKLICSAIVPTGTAAVLDCGTLCRPAVVRWQTGGSLGICFDSELDIREISALIARSIALDALMKSRT